VTGDWKRLAVVAAACALLAGCSGDSAPGADDDGGTQASESPLAAPSAVAFTDCAEACEGEIDGARYKILLPKEWNGTLLLYSGLHARDVQGRALARVQQRRRTSGP
jgi:hypothetical protein